MRNERKSGERPIVSVILAAGRGARMQSAAVHKVCHTVEGRPAIARAVESYHRCGITSHYIVVGAMAEQVMEAVSSAPGHHFFCYQPDPRGTGNAARVAASLLSAMCYDADVLVVAGDKVVDPAFLKRAIRGFRESGDDLAFVVGDADDFPSSGRVIYNAESAALGVVEVFDIAKMQLLLALRRMTADRVVPADEAEQLAISYLSQEGKASAALGQLWEGIKSGRPVTSRALESSVADQAAQLRLNGGEYSAEALAEARHANLSVYLFRARALYTALEHINADNAQQEEYLTDAVAALASRGFAVRAVPVDYPQQVMAFNTTAELRKIEDYLASRRRERAAAVRRPLRPVHEWLAALESGASESVRCLVEVYGAGHLGVEHRRRQIVTMCREYQRRFGDCPVVITRAPGRINVMGRHVDHQGGHGNMIAIDRDVLIVAGARDDRQIVAHNLDARQFADRRFDLDVILTGYRDGDWVGFVNGPEVRQAITENRGDWSHYLQAAAARFQAAHDDVLLHGMNIVVSGNVPVAAGLSSSSALVVAAAEALCALNTLKPTPQRFVELCGEGEWYVGTRGGAGDHAAMKFARQGHVVQVGFFPMSLVDVVPLPADHMFLVCNSHAKARKTAGARDVFNHRVACYHIGRELMKLAHRHHAERVHHLRDLNGRNLGVDYPGLLQALKSLPVEMRRCDIRAALPPEITDRFLATHSEEMDVYPIRPVVIFGLAECERSRTCPELLREGNAAEFGRLMNASHDGDRVVKWDRHGNSWPFEADYTDAALDALAARSAQGDDAACLAYQPGAYSCSIPQIDQMVDLALAVEGVAGAQIAGAGLGGCMMALVHTDAAEDLRRALVRHFYESHGLEPDMIDCTPVAGSGALAL